MIESLAPPMTVERLDFIRVTRGDDADVAALLAEIDRLQCLCDAAEEAVDCCSADPDLYVPALVMPGGLQFSAEAVEG